MIFEGITAPRFRAKRHLHLGFTPPLPRRLPHLIRKVVTMEDTELELEAEQAAELAEPTDAELELLRQELETSRGNERAAVHSLRAALLAGESALAPEMLAGETLAEVEASYRAAMDLLGRLREHVAKETAGRIPAGAPGRTRQAPRTPFDKIRAGLETTR